VGGTSLSTPDWVSFFTIVNSLRAGQGKVHSARRLLTYTRFITLRITSLTSMTLRQAPEPALAMI